MKLFKRAILANLLFVFFSVNIARADTGSGPLAAAYSLFMISKRGYPNLCLDEKNSSEAIKKLVQVLSSPKSMFGGIDIDQPTAFPLRGIDFFIRNRGCWVGYIGFQGLRPCPQGYSAGTTPKLDWICSGIGAKSGECVLVGWYKYDYKQKVYKRTGGEWLSVSSYRQNNRGGVPIELAVVNSANGSSMWLNFESMKTAKLVEPDKNDRIIRSFYPDGPIYKVSAGLTGTATAILEGAATFRLR